MPHARYRTLIASGLMGLVSLAASGQDSPVVTVDGPYARAVPPGQPNSGVFMTLTNASDTPQALVSAASPAARTVELHTHTLVDGVMQMRPVERIEIPAGGSAVLKPGGLHIMLIGLNGNLAPGMTVDLTLTFDDGSTAAVQAPVKHIDVHKLDR